MAFNNRPFSFYPLKRILERRECNEDTHLAFIDVEEAFDKVSRRKL